jgi:hypothetical protein
MTIFHLKRRSEDRRSEAGIARFPIILCLIVLVLAGFARQLASASEATQLAVIGGLLMATLVTRSLHTTLRKTGSY